MYLQRNVQGDVPCGASAKEDTLIWTRDTSNFTPSRFDALSLTSLEKHVTIIIQSNDSQE
jgi:hypothetical protein